MCKSIITRSGKTINLDIINYLEDFDAIPYKASKASVHLYAINPNQQKSVIADFGTGQVSLNLIGYELGPGNSMS
jgi:hypothetical protein